MIGRLKIKKLGLLRCKSPALYFFKINNTFDITTTIKYTDNCDSTCIIVNQIIHNEIIYWQLMYSHRMPRFPFDKCIACWHEIQ